MSGVKAPKSEVDPKLFTFESHINLNWPEAITIIGVAFAIAAMVVGIVLISTVLGK